MVRTCCAAALVWAAAALAAPPADRAADIAALAKPGPDPAATRAAWDRVTAAGAPALLPLLAAWPDEDPVAGHWLRTAFDHIAKAHPEKLPEKELLAFAANDKANGKARRAALAALERARPGTAARFLAERLNDTEFGPDAVAERIAAADALADPAAQAKLLRDTFAAATDLEQSLLLAKRLAGTGDAPDLFAHLGAVRHWRAIGPFPVSPEDGLAKSFPPETKLDFAAEYEGKAGKLKWARATADPADAKLDVAKHGIKPDDGAVCYTAATINLSAATKAEVRASAVDNVTVWVNGAKVLERASEYRSMFRPDRYRAAVDLPAGESVVLVKLTKTKAEEVRGKPGAPVRWDALVRFVSPATGRAVPFTQPEGK